MGFHVSGNMTSGDLENNLEKLDKRLDSLDKSFQAISQGLKEVREAVDNIPNQLAELLAEALREQRKSH